MKRSAKNVGIVSTLSPLLDRFRYGSELFPFLEWFKLNSFQSQPEVIRSDIYQIEIIWCQPRIFDPLLIGEEILPNEIGRNLPLRLDQNYENNANQKMTWYIYIT